MISRLETHINIYARVGEDSGIWGVSGNVSVELLTISVPEIRICLAMFSYMDLSVRISNHFYEFILREDPHHLTL